MYFGMPHWSRILPSHFGDISAPVKRCKFKHHLKVHFSHLLSFRLHYSAMALLTKYIHLFYRCSRLHLHHSSLICILVSLQPLFTFHLSLQPVGVFFFLFFLLFSHHWLPFMLLLSSPFFNNRFFWPLSLHPFGAELTLDLRSKRWAVMLLLSNGLRYSGEDTQGKPLHWPWAHHRYNTFFFN